MTTTVGMVGLGIMGSAMSSNLLAAGFAVAGCDIDPGRIGDFTANGGTAAASPRDAVADADVAILSMPSIAAFEDVVGGSDGLAASGRSGLVVIDTSTHTVVATVVVGDEPQGVAIATITSSP